MSDIVITVVSGETVDIGLSTPGMQGPQGVQGPIGPSGATGASGVTPTFSIGSVVNTTASGSNVTISGGPDYVLDFLFPSQSLIVNSQSGTTYTAVSGDNGKVISLNNASGIVFIMPSGLPSDFSCSVARVGSGVVTISGASGVSVFSSAPALNLASQYAVATIFSIGADQYIAAGELSV